MRVGFLTSILWDRYGPTWQRLVAAVGAEPVLPEPEAVLRAGEALTPEDGWLPWLARATLRALGDVDAVVVPRLLPSGLEGAGSAQDPWVADLPALLARAEPGAAPLLAVPAETGADVEAAVIPLLTRLQRDAGRVRRAWAQHRSDALRPWRPAAAAHHAAGTRRVALVGAPWWCVDALARHLTGPGETLIGQHASDPAELRAEGRRWRADLNDVDAEVLGGVRRFARRSDVSTVRLIADDAAMADAWWSRRARTLAAERVEVATLAEAVDSETLVRLFVPGGLRPPA